MFKNLFHREDKNGGLIIWAVAAALVVGLLAGIGGELLARNYILDYLSSQTQFTELSNTFDQLLAKYNFLTKEKQSGPLEIVIRRPDAGSGLQVSDQVTAGNFLESLKQTTVTFFPENKDGGKDLLLSAYQKQSALGRGFILTSDGWLVTSSQVLPNAKGSYVAVTAKGEVYQVEKMVADSLTPAMFVKIAVNNLPVLNLTKSADLSLGQTLAVLDADGGLRFSRLENIYFRPGKQLADEVASSDKLDNYYVQSDQFDNVFFSEPVVDSGGGAVGLMVGVGSQKLILPLDNIRSQFAGVLKEGKVVRVSLGVDYLSLEQLAINPAVNSSYKNFNQGALIYSNARLGFAGVKKGSPAVIAGLLASDLILKIDGEQINDGNNLSTAIQNYHVGDEVELTISRAGQEMKLKVKLAELK